MAIETIDMKEVSKVLGKGIAKAIEERTARANDEQAEIQSKPRPMDDDQVITTEVETVNENGEKKTVTDQVTEMAGPKEGTLEVLCVRGERLRDTSYPFGQMHGSLRSAAGVLVDTRKSPQNRQ